MTYARRDILKQGAAAIAASLVHSHHGLRTIGIARSSHGADAATRHRVEETGDPSGFPIILAARIP
jgi:hypothetical protein